MEISNILTSLKKIGTNFLGGKIVEGQEVDYIIVIPRQTDVYLKSSAYNK